MTQVAMIFSAKLKKKAALPPYSILVALFFLTITPRLLASGKRDQPVLFSFHMETTKEEWPKFAQAVKLGNPTQQFYFKTIPSFTDADVAWFYPFVAEDTQSYGVALKLKPAAGKKLIDLTDDPAQRSRLLAAYVQPAGNQAVPLRTFLEIDRRISDGILVIWKGLSQFHLEAFQQRIPHVDQLRSNVSEE